MIQKKLTLAIALLLIFFATRVFADVSISVKVNDIIISNYDIKREALYLQALNKNLGNLDNDQILKIAKESIIRETIKLIELDKYYTLDQSNPLLDKVIEDFYLKLDMQNEMEFENHLNKYDFNIAEIKKKIEIETTWNSLINKIYKNQIKINKEKLLKKISNIETQNKKRFLLLYEIIFEKKIGEDLDELFLKIEESIKEIGFENTATIYSSSDSSKFGGKIGWVEEDNLAGIIKSEVLKISVNNYTKPIFINNNFLILKLKDMKEELIKVDKNLLLKQMTEYEINTQLGRFSGIHYNKIKINTEVNEF